MILSDVVTVSISTNTTPTFGQASTFGQSRNVTLISNSAKPPSVEFTINVRQPLITASHFSGHRNSDKALVGGCDKPAFSFISTDSVFHPNLCNTLRMGTRYCIPILVAIDEEISEKFEVTEGGCSVRACRGSGSGATSHRTRHQSLSHLRSADAIIRMALAAPRLS